MDDVAQADRRAEIEPVHRNGYHRPVAVAVGGDRRHQIDPVHDGAAQRVAQRIGVIGQDHLQHLRRGIGGPSGFH